MARKYSAGPTEHMRRFRSGFLFFLITAVCAVLIASAAVVSFFFASAEKNKAAETYQAAETAKENAKHLQETKNEAYQTLISEIDGLKQKIAELS